jgi:ParB-like chromosome segregation protein Spo0J
MIAAGHGRWLAAKSNHLSEAPVIRAKFLTDADRRAFALAENRIADLTGWDDMLLAEELSILFEDGYNLEFTGFTTSDLDFSIPEEKIEDEPEQVALPEEDAQVVCREGDLWLIGPHRLHCGDAMPTGDGECDNCEDYAQVVNADV